MIILQNISKTYTNKTLFRDLDYKFSNGLNHVKGFNGSGKTTLLNIISGQDQNYKGKVQVDTDGDISYFPNILDVFSIINAQQFILSIYAELNVNSDEQYSFLSEVFDTSFFKDHSIQELSEGQRKKVILALSLIKSKKHWLLDEPFNGLDQSTAQSLVIFLKKESSERVVVFTDHRNEIPVSPNQTLTLEL